MRNKPRWPLMKKRLYVILRYILIYTATLIIALPIIWIFVMSLKTKDQIFNTSFIPNPITFDHYWWVLTETPFLNSLKNSFILAAAVTLISVVLGSLAAYSISNFRYTGRLLFSRLVLFSYLVPAILLIVPIYLTLSSLGLINKLSGLGIAHLAFILPFCLTLLTSFFDGVPHEIEEAARIDGCTRLQAFRFVIFPLVTPGIVTAGLFAWLLSWNEYLFALTLISTEALKTLPIRLNWYTNTGLAYELWGPMQAESVLYSLPVLVLFFVFQKYLAEGLTAGAVKG